MFLLFYVVQKNYCQKSCIVFEDLLPHKIHEPYNKVARVTTTSEVCKATMLVLLMARKQKILDGVVSNCMMYIQGFMKICSLVQKLLGKTDRNTYMTIP
jgi:hypothetical protein